MPKNVVISADGVCDITPELKEKFAIKYYPYYIRFRGKDYRDNIDITLDEIFDGFYEDGSLPKTASSSIKDYAGHFKKLTADGNEVVHISMGSGITSGYEHAALAAEQVAGVHVVDSCNLSSGVGQLAVRAGEFAQQGLGSKEIVENVEKFIPHLHTSFTIDTMEFMVAGGRCPALAGKAAGMLKCHPCIEVDEKNNGRLHMGKIYRGKTEKVLAKYVGDQLSRYGEVMDDYVFATHSGRFADGELDPAFEEIKKHVSADSLYPVRASCTCCCHCGPRTLGVLFVSKF